MLIKVCGICRPEQAAELSTLPSMAYLGFIFYPQSPRYVGAEKPIIAGKNLKKVGVFVNASLEELLFVAKRWQLDFIQLHGEESPEYAAQLRALGYSVIKAFAIASSEHFAQLQGYENACDYYLFDSKGPAPGGNGFAFDWACLQAYQGDKPYFLSGGISEASLAALRALDDPRLLAIDLNSKFERQAGDKDVSRIAQFIQKLKK